MTPTRQAQIETVIAESEARGAPWTNQRIYDQVRGSYHQLAAYLKARRAAQWVRVCTVPEDDQPRRLLTHVGLVRFRQWLAAPPASPAVMQQVVLLHMVSLSYEAFLMTDPEECKRLCRPFQQGEETRE